MSLMSKLLISSVVATLTLSASSLPTSEDLKNYVSKVVVKNPAVKIQSVSVMEKKTDKRINGWTVMFIEMNLKYKGKDIKAPEMIFTKDGLITGMLVDAKTSVNYRNALKPTVPQSFYDDEHLLYGNKDAKHKIIVFSDPQCPFCQDNVPQILETVKANPTKLALYYYHLPLLRIHPVSGILTKVMHIAQMEGKPEITDKMYKLDIKPRETNVKKVLEAIKKQTGYVVDAKKLNDKDVIEAIKLDEKRANRMLVGGTPTVYIDGKWDESKVAYKDLVK